MKNKIAYAKILLGLLLGTAVLTACIPLDDTTPEAPLVEVVTVSVERPTVTAPPTPLTETSTPPASPTPSSTAVASYTPRPTITPRPTATPFPNLVWSDEFTAVATFASNEVAWSPVKDELLFNSCDFRLDSAENPPSVIFYASAPRFNSIDITPSGYECGYLTTISWNPIGSRIVLVGGNSEEPYILFQHWVMNSIDFFGRKLNVNLANPLGWMDNDTFAFGDRCGTGCSYVHIIDMYTEQTLASGSLGGTFEELTTNYIGATFGIGTNHLTAAFMSLEKQEDYVPGYESGPHVSYLQLGEINEDPYQNSYNSSFHDWLPQTNKMLVMVGERGVLPDWEEFYYQSPTSDLQLWDVETDELTLLVPDGLYGRFSPDGHYLASIIPGESGPTMQLRQTPFDQVLLEAPTLAVGHQWSRFLPFFSFSPNNQYLAFFTTAESLPPTGSFKPSAQSPDETYLAVLDLTRNTIVWSQPVAIGDLFWSPDDTHLLYRANDGNLTLLNVANGRTHPLLLILLIVRSGR
ncbi:MAG: hypothetical protein CL608_30240 [Anaerolineaceae bacterium]|nr:hypothetical protein [Anaerolineaceae bacterium]